jgi:hypothetical protein
VSGLVRGTLAPAARALVLPTLCLLAVLAFLPGRLELAIRVYALVVCAVALVLTYAALRRAFPRARPLRPPTRQRKERRTIPPALTRMEHEVALGHASSFDLHYLLRPRLRALTGELLLARRGIALERDRDRARDTLGDETWELVRDDRPPPDDRLARGLSIQELERVVQSIERL